MPLQPPILEYVQLVDEAGNGIGTALKLEAHEGAGRLHRAISVLLFSPSGSLILQRRASSKYHFAEKWANTCCSHPLGEETPLDAARRALQNELGMQAELAEQFTFSYAATDEESGLTEREYDHVFVGVTQAWPDPNPEQVSEWRLSDPSELAREMLDEPESFVPWLEEILCEASHREVPSAALASFGARWLAVK